MADAVKHFLSKSDILGKEDMIVEDLYVPSWDAWVKVKTLTALERDYFESSTVMRRAGKVININLEGIRARLCVLTLVDDEGNRIFTDEDEAILGTKSAKAVDLIFGVAQRLNGLREEDVEALVGESNAAQNGALHSDSL